MKWHAAPTHTPTSSLFIVSFLSLIIILSPFTTFLYSFFFFQMYIYSFKFRFVGFFEWTTKIVSMNSLIAFWSQYLLFYSDHVCTFCATDEFSVEILALLVTNVYHIYFQSQIQFIHNLCGNYVWGKLNWTILEEKDFQQSSKIDPNKMFDTFSNNESSEDYWVCRKIYHIQKVNVLLILSYGVVMWSDALHMR